MDIPKHQKDDRTNCIGSFETEGVWLVGYAWMAKKIEEGGIPVTLRRLAPPYGYGYGPAKV